MYQLIHVCCRLGLKCPPKLMWCQFGQRWWMWKQLSCEMLPQFRANPLMRSQLNGILEIIKTSGDEGSRLVKI